MTFRERQVIGTTSLTPQEVQDAVQEMGDVYKGNAYHLLQRCVDRNAAPHVRRRSPRSVPERALI